MIAIPSYSDDNKIDGVTTALDVLHVEYNLRAKESHDTVISRLS
jgi:hypothetical protein